MRAFKKPPAAAGKQRVAAKKQRRAIHLGAVKRDVASGMPGHIYHFKRQAQRLQPVAAPHGCDRHRHFLLRRAPDAGARGLHQLGDAADMVCVVVRH